MRNNRGQGSHGTAMSVEDLPNVMLTFNAQPETPIIAQKERLKESVSVLDRSMDFL